ncbi:MAG: putative sulfate exporter family transporter [Alphaproteobacteria bacterium]|nr:putative sulfate exporter family transporter [Alphaproteobacteria bacterium]
MIFSVKRSFHEDWMAVFAGFMIIALTVLIYEYVPSLPMLFNPKEKWSGTEFLTGFLSRPNLLRIVYIFLAFAILAWVGLKLAGKPTNRFFGSFAIITLLAVIAQVVSTHTSVKALSLETVFFSILIGLLISNTMKLPGWIKQAVQSEFYIKTGLVLLGTTVLFSNIMKAGALGLVQALVVVISVWYLAFWIARKMKVDPEMSTMLASAVSICGVSAAIATCGAIKGDNKKLSYVISLVLIVAIPMMILMPYLAKWMGLTQEVAGAWIGGTIDTTGAVVASGTVIGETAQKYAVIIKSAQNVLLGLAAFAISIYWSYSGQGATVEKPTARIIWNRFPKFVIGFILASVLFSFFLNPETVKQAGDTIKGYQNIWFSIAFVCIGLETRFSDIFSATNRKPMYAFLLAQLFNIVITFVVAWLLFNF